MIFSLKNDQLSKVKTYKKKLKLTKIVLPILSQLRVTKVNTIKKFGKENSKITSNRLNVRILKRKGKKVHFYLCVLFTSMVILLPT